MTRERITDALDVLGLLALAVGVAGGLWSFIGWTSIAAGGAIVLIGSALAASRDRPPKVKPVKLAPKARHLQGDGLIRTVS